MSHFNAGNVWGKVVKAEEKTTRRKGAPFLHVEIDCSSQEYGPVRAFGRLWGKEKIAALKELCEDDEKPFVRLKGFYGQYVLEGKLFSSYTFYNVLEAGGQDPRAAFVLVGDVAGKELNDEGEGVVRLLLKRRNGEGERGSKGSAKSEGSGTGMDMSPPDPGAGGQGGDSDAEEMEVTLFDLEGYYEIEAGDLVEVRGMLRKRAAEDFYGGSSDDVIRPYVMFTKKRTRKAT